LRLFHIKTGGHKIFLDRELSRKKRLGEIKPLALSALPLKSFCFRFHLTLAEMQGVDTCLAKNKFIFFERFRPELRISICKGV